MSCAEKIHCCPKCGMATVENMECRTCGTKYAVLPLDSLDTLLQHNEFCRMRAAGEDIMRVKNTTKNLKTFSVPAEPKTLNNEGAKGGKGGTKGTKGGKPPKC